MPQIFLDALPLPADIQVSGPPPKISIDVSSSSMAVLGANPVTGLAPSSGLAPAICMVLAENSPLSDAANAACHFHVQGATAASQYFINGTPMTGTQLRPLKEGDTLSLSMFKGVVYYSYRVRFQETAKGILGLFRSNPQAQGIPSPPKAAAASNKAVHDSPASFTSHSNAHPATEECACPYCLEIQVQSTTLVPCGHSFCKDCITACHECPTCRTAVQSQVPCRAVDNIIHAMVKSNFFSADDVQVYEERRSGVVDLVDSTLAHAPPPLLSSNLRPSKRQRRRAGKTLQLAPIQEGASEATAICIDD